MRAAVWCALWLLGVAALGCAGAASRGGVGPQPLAAGGATDPEWLAASRLAPDYVARVREAERAFQSERTPEGRSEQQRRVALLGTAARAEAARIALLRQADTYEQRIAKAVEQRAQWERQRVALERTRELERAAAAERAEADWVFTALLRAGVPNARERDRIWELCVRRAQALLAAASALGATGEPVAQAELQLTAARTAKLPERIHKGRQALHAACIALGAVRAQRPAPSPAERGDLLARLQALRIPAQPSAAGLVLEFGGSPELEARLRLLGEWLPAFPHGPVIVACAGPRGCAGAWVASLRDRLGARLRLESGARAPAAGVVRVMLPAYLAEPARF